MVQQVTYDNQNLTDVAIVTTTETVVSTLAGVNTPGPGYPVRLQGNIVITLGTGTTAVTLRVRRGSAITDTLVGEANVKQIGTAAGSTEDHDIQVTDTPGEVASQTYVLTVQQTAASANGSNLEAHLRAEVGP